MGHSGLCPEIAEAYTAAEGANHQKAYTQQLSLQVYSPPLACMRSNDRLGLKRGMETYCGENAPEEDGILDKKQYLCIRKLHLSITP